VLLLTVFALSPPARAGDNFHEPGAVIVNITERDLNRILQGTFRSSGGPRFEGTQERGSKSTSDLHYLAELSEPVLHLGEDGDSEFGLDILQAEFYIGRLEWKFGKRTAHCEDLGVVIDPAQPIPVRLALRFAIQDWDLRILPLGVWMPDPRPSFQLIKPSRCENTRLPKWLLWWLGKSRLKNHFARLDDILLAKAHRSAEKLNRGEGLLRRHLQIDAINGGGETRDIYLYPQSLDTSRGSLFVVLDGASLPENGTAVGSAQPVERFSENSYVALSESFLNSVLDLKFSGAGALRKPGGNFQRMLGSRSGNALIPGLRHVESKDRLYVSFAFHSAPRVDVATVHAADSRVDPSLEKARAEDPGHRVLLRIHLSDIELHIWEGRDEDRSLVGTMRIESGTVGVAPFLNILGGISFETVENEWVITSRGTEFNEPLLSATLQELVFGEMFETRYDPVWRDAFRIADTSFVPRGLASVADYLVIELGSASSSHAKR